MKTNDGPEIQAIPTIYKGIEFRSRLELVGGVALAEWRPR